MPLRSAPTALPHRDAAPRRRTATRRSAAPRRAQFTSDFLCFRLAGNAFQVFYSIPCHNRFKTTDQTYPYFELKFNLRIFQRFRLVKFIEKFKTRVKNLEIEKIIAFDKYLHELFFSIYFHLSKNLFLTLKNN